ncbi:citrate synthase [gamma proteobacterium HTCC5015]|nr:citrate synthase [gamma proteobacterium HTCC5015]
MSEYVPGLGGVVATKSKVSSLDGANGILAFRGYSIQELATKSNFEETAQLMLDNELPSAAQLEAFTQKLRENYPVDDSIIQMLKALPKNTHPMAVLQAATAALDGVYAGEEGNDSYNDDMSVRLIGQYGTIVAAWEHIRNGNEPIAPRKDLGYAANFLYMLRGEEPDAADVRVMDACLVLHAEHTINASTFTAMVTASALARPALVMSSAVGTLAGPLHGGANERVLHMLEEIGTKDKAEAWIDNALANKDVIWGMGHREYAVKDPRAKILEKMLREYGEEKGSVSPLFETALTVEEICEARLGAKGVYPNVDFYSGILYQELGIPVDLFTPIFAVSRLTGWLAHWREQIANNRIFRPTQIYEGYKLRDYKAIDQR